MNYKSVIILGPTAVGKTRLGAYLASKFNGEIISADSRQVYRLMDIGTGKDFNDYIVDGKKINYHLIDIVHPSEEFDLFKFIEHFNFAFNNILNQHKLPFIVGGTGMYLHAIIKRYELTQVDFNQRFQELNSFTHDELISKLKKLKNELHNKTDLTDKERTIKAIIVAEEQKANKIIPVDTNPFIIGVMSDRDKIKERITVRLKERLENGMIEEAEELLKAGIPHDKLMFFGLEYKFLSLYLRGELNYNDMYQKLNSAIHKFAKRQMTWFRKMEREGIKINWVEAGDYKAAEKLLRRYFS